MFLLTLESSRTPKAILVEAECLETSNRCLQDMDWYIKKFSEIPDHFQGDCENWQIINFGLSKPDTLLHKTCMG